MISAAPNGASSLGKRGGAMGGGGRNALQPQQRDRLSRRSEVAKPPTASRNAEFGTCAAPETSNGEPSAAVIARLAAMSSSPRSTSVRSLSGRGITFSVTSVMTASVPQEPASSLQRS